MVPAAGGPNTRTPRPRSVVTSTSRPATKPNASRGPSLLGSKRCEINPSVRSRPLRTRSSSPISSVLARTSQSAGASTSSSQRLGTRGSSRQGHNPERNPGHCTECRPFTIPFFCRVTTRPFVGRSRSIANQISARFRSSEAARLRAGQNTPPSVVSLERSRSMPFQPKRRISPSKAIRSAPSGIAAVGKVRRVKPSTRSSRTFSWTS